MGLMDEGAGGDKKRDRTYERYRCREGIGAREGSVKEIMQKVDFFFSLFCSRQVTGSSLDEGELIREMSGGRVIR